MELIDRFVRIIQGERKGMSAGAVPAELRRKYELLPTSIAIQTLVRLADVSFWQGLIDFVVMKAAGLYGTIIRAGQRNWVDTKFKENWKKAKDAGIPRGSYWFYDSREEPKKQAALWWSLLQEDPGELIHVVDAEENYGGPYAGKAFIKEFILEFIRLSKLPDSKIVIYTGFFWWADRVGNDIFFRRFKLWLAWYAGMSIVRIPAPWIEQDLLLWQYTSSGDGTSYGVSSQEIDLNYFCCSPEEYNKMFKLVDPGPVDPDDGENPMPDYYELRSTDITKYRTIRLDHSVKSDPVPESPNMPAGEGSVAKSRSNEFYTYDQDVVDATVVGGYSARKGDIWRKIYEVNGKPAVGWMAEIHLGTRYLSLTYVNDPTNDVDLPDLVITQTFTAEGYLVFSTTANGNIVTTILKKA